MDRLPAPLCSMIRLMRDAADFLACRWTVQHMKRMMRLPPDKVAEIQEKKFLSIVEYAYREIPFYKKHWDDAGVGPDDIRSIADIVKLPVITRQDVREGLRAGLFPGRGDRGRGRIFGTSGSTGVPLDVAYDRSSVLRIMLIFSPEMISAFSGLEIRSATLVILLTSDVLPPLGSVPKVM